MSFSGIMPLVKKINKVVLVWPKLRPPNIVELL